MTTDPPPGHGARAEPQTRPGDPRPLAGEPDARRRLRLAALVPHTRAEGPGNRFAVWVQGCSIRCSGCFNPHMWGTGGSNSTVGDLLARLRLAHDAEPLEGVTLLGGEPFEQAAAAAQFANGAQALGLSVMTFTGLVREDLEADVSPGVQELLAATDLLVDGPYVADAPDLARPWVGSTNQRFHVLTERYRDLAAGLARMPDSVEIRVSTSGEIAVNGWATVDQLDALLAGQTAPIGRGSVR